MLLVESNPQSHVVRNTTRRPGEKSIFLGRQRAATVYLHPARHALVAFQHLIDLDENVISVGTTHTLIEGPTKKHVLLPSIQGAVPHIDDTTFNNNIAPVESFLAILRRQHPIVLLRIATAQNQQEHDRQFDGQ